MFGSDLLSVPLLLTTTSSCPCLGVLVALPPWPLPTLGVAACSPCVYVLLTRMFSPLTTPRGVLPSLRLGPATCTGLPLLELNSVLYVLPPRSPPRVPSSPAES